MRRVTENTALLLVALPVGDQMVGFELDSFPADGYRTGLNRIGGVPLSQIPGGLRGRQVKDLDPHTLELTIRQNFANAEITATLDDQLVYHWSGPVGELSQPPMWISRPGVLSLGAMAAGWVVSGVKVKRLDSGKQE